MDVALVRHCILHSALYKQLSLAKIEACEESWLLFLRLTKILRLAIKWAIFPT